MFRAREVTILEQSMINGGIDTSTGIGRHFLQKLQQAGYSHEKVEVSLYFNEAKVTYMAKIVDLGNYVAGCSWRFISDNRGGRKDRWNIFIDKDGLGFKLIESNIFSQYDPTGKRIPDV